MMFRWVLRLFRFAPYLLFVRAPVFALRHGVLVLAVFATATAGVWTLRGFSQLIDDPSTLQASRQLLYGGSQTARLFQRMVDAGDITFSPQTLSFKVHFNCAERATFGTASQDASLTDKEAARNLYCGSDLGNTIKDELQRYFTNTNVVAVRDDWRDGQTLPLQKVCADGVRIALFVPQSCFGNQWSGSTASEPNLPLFETDRAKPVPIAQTKNRDNEPETDVLRGLLSGTLEPALINAAAQPKAPIDVAKITRAVDFEALDPEIYGFLSRSLQTSHGDWRRFVNGSGSIDLQRVINNDSNRPRKIKVQYVGELLRADIGTMAEEYFSANSHRILCEGASSQQGCKALYEEEAEIQRKLDTAGSKRFLPPLATAGEVVFEVPARTTVRVRMRVVPSKALHRRLRLLGVFSIRKPSEQRSTIREGAPETKLSHHIRLRCRTLLAPRNSSARQSAIVQNIASNASASEKRCVLHWREAKPAVLPTGDQSVDERELILVDASRKPEVLTQITELGTQDNPVMTTLPTEKALDIGLMQLIGFGQDDKAGALYQLSRTLAPSEKKTVALSLRSDVQTIVQENTLQLLQSKPRFADYGPKLLSNRQNSRLLNVVLMDAGPVKLNDGGSDDYRNDSRLDPATGSILAFSTPRPVSRTNLMHEWDIQAQRIYRPAGSRLSMRAWADNDRFNAPGSAFKPIVALAGMQKALEGDDVAARYIAGTKQFPGYTRAQLYQTLGPEFGFRFNAREIAVPVFKDGNSQPGQKDIGNRGRAMCARIVAGRCGDEARLNLHDMIVSSDNVYFMRLALYLDADAVSTKDAEENRIEPFKPSPTDLQLNDMAQFLWPAEASNLLVGTDASPISRVLTTPVQLDSMLVESPRLLRLALNGIGQSSQMTSLALASVAGSIATGNRVLPTLLQNRPQPLQGAAILGNRSGTAANHRREMLGELRRGMKNVFEPAGTGWSAIQSQPESFRKRFHGKTGTAIMSDETQDGNVGWVMGWIEGLNVPGLEERRVAFACQMTHIRTSTGGGGTCGRFMVDLLRDLEDKLKPAETSEAEAG